MPKVGQKFADGPEESSPNVRLALGGGVNPKMYEDGGAIANGLQPPSVRLATLGPPEALAKGIGVDPNQSPVGRLAHKVNHQGDRTLEEGARLQDPRLPALLVSYVYLQQFLNNKHRYHYRDWVMDSGAFSAFNSGTEIRLQDYIDCCKRLLVEDPTLTEVFALDVIGYEKESLRNTEEMWRQGVQAIPCFHYGEPWEFLLHISKNYPKIALGGLVGQKVTERDKWIGQCFARIWPKRIHGFGLSGEETLMKFPFHSVDATNWEIGPCKYGVWRAFGKQRVSVRGSQQNLRAEVEWYLDLEQRVRERWKKEMTVLASIDAPSVKLAYSTGGGGNSAATGFAKPDVRLAAISDSNSGVTTDPHSKIEAFKPRD